MICATSRSAIREDHVDSGTYKPGTYSADLSASKTKTKEKYLKHRIATELTTHSRALFFHSRAFLSLLPAPMPINFHSKDDGDVDTIQVKRVLCTYAALDQYPLRSKALLPSPTLACNRWLDKESCSPSHRPTFRKFPVSIALPLLPRAPLKHFLHSPLQPLYHLQLI